MVDELEERYPAFDGLNLTFETREGILKHCSRANAEHRSWASRAAWRAASCDGTQPSLEAQLANLADEIAYNAHDIDDGVRSGLLTIEQLAHVPLFERHVAPCAAAASLPSANAPDAVRDHPAHASHQYTTSSIARSKVEGASRRPGRDDADRELAADCLLHRACAPKPTR